MDTVLNTDFQRFIRGRARRAFTAVLHSETDEELFNTQCDFDNALNNLQTALTSPLLDELEKALVARDKLEGYVSDYSYLQGFRDGLRILCV